MSHPIVTAVHTPRHAVQPAGLGRSAALVLAAAVAHALFSVQVALRGSTPALKLVDVPDDHYYVVQAAVLPALYLVVFGVMAVLASAWLPRRSRLGAVDMFGALAGTLAPSLLVLFALPCVAAYALLGPGMAAWVPLFSLLAAATGLTLAVRRVAAATACGVRRVAGALVPSFLLAFALEAPFVR